MVLVTTLALFLAGPLLPRFAGEAGMLIVVGLFVWVEGGHRRSARYVLPVLLAVAAVCMLSASVERLATGVPLRCAGVACLVYCWITILLSLLRADRVTHDEIFGTITLYVLAALIWAGAYALLNVCVPGSFNVSASGNSLAQGIHAADLVRFRLIYFSFVTMATQGYGDITPQNFLAQRLVILQTIFGQFYIAVVVAYLVSLLMKGRAGRDGSE